MNGPINTAGLKRNALVYMKKKNPSPWLVVLCAVGMQNALSYLSTRVLNLYQVMEKLQQALNTYMVTNDMDRYTEEYFRAGELMNTSFGAQAVCLLLRLAILMLSVGLTIYFIQVVRTGKGGFGNLLDGLVCLPRVIGYSLISGFFVFLWGLLLIIPGIIAALRYSQGVYLLLTHPEMGILDCLRGSKELMREHKGQYFLLRLSFIGWIIGLRVVNIGLSALLGTLSILIVLPLAVFVQMYLGFTLFQYHEALQGRFYDPTAPRDPEPPVL